MTGRLLLPSLLCLSVSLVSCARTLPDEDKRIYAATPSAKVSADILWNDYTADQAAADRQYWGKALEVSGDITSISSEPPHTFIVFSLDGQPAVRATLLDEEAGAIVSSAKTGDRITLRCFCEGFDELVRLRSCIKRP